MDQRLRRGGDAAPLLLLAVVAVAMLSGCEALFGYQPGERLRGNDIEGPVRFDVGGESTDFGVPTDMTSDKGIRPELGRTDFKVLLDMTVPDAPSTDASRPTDSAMVGSACLNSVPTVLSSKLVGCTPSGGVDQCGATLLCNAASGWHLCSASEYLARGGSNASPIFDAWIDACLRDGSASLVVKPTASLGRCKSCTSSSGGLPLKYKRLCASSTQQGSNDHHIGVTTSPICASLGPPLVGDSGYWDAANSVSLHDAALCCQ